MRKEVKMWGEFVFNEPYEGQDIYQINEIDLPISYIEFMKRHNGGEGDIGNTWFRLYRLEELQELNDNLEIDKYLPKHIIIVGCDGELYGINADGYYFNVQEIIEEEYLTLLGNDIEQLSVQVNKLWD